MTSVENSSFTVVRSPLLPVNTLVELFKACRSGPVSAALCKFYQQPLVVEALYLASPSLYSEWISWKQNTDQPLRPKVEMALLKYAIRMSSRCTPFGLFSGVSIVKEAASTDITIDAEKSKPVTRFDSNGLVQLYNRLLSIVTVRRSLRYIVNNSLYQLGNELRYSEFIENLQTRLVRISAIETNELIESVISKASRYQSFSDLVKFVAKKANTKADRAAAFVEVLIDNKLLLSELEPTVTGLPYANRLADGLRLLAGQVPIIDEFLKLQPWQNIPPSVEHFQKVDSWFANHQFANEHHQSFIQTNLYLTLAPRFLSNRVLNEIRKQVSQICGLFAQTEPVWLTTFKKRFHERYENSEVPLLTALDNEAGIGLQLPADFQPADAPLLEALITSIENNPVGSKPPDQLDGLRRLLFIQALSQGIYSIDIPESAVATLPVIQPSSWSILGSLLATSSKEVDEGNYKFMLKSVLGPSSALLLGRFCLDSPELSDCVQNALSQEEAQQPDVIYAEIVHLTGGRAGNINSRPVLRKYEIPYITPPAVESSYVIPLSDILISVPDGQTVVLRSRRLGKRIIPRLTTAHNTTRGDDVYRFLYSVGRYPNSFGRDWSWAEWQNEPFLPRVVYKKLIISRAQWYFKEGDLDGFTSFVQAFEYFRQRFRMPSWVVLVMDGDNELVLDLDLPISQQLLEAEVRNRGKIRLIEWLFEPEQCWITGKKQEVFTHELVISCPAPIHNIPRSPTLKPTSLYVDRTYLPGSEWLYLKVYTGPQTAEALLVGSIHPVLKLLKTQKLIDEWFFVRYYDPEFHLRVRIKISPAQYAGAETFGSIIHNIYAASQEALGKNLLHRLQFDTYQREIERYGPETVHICEQIFGADSEALVQLLVAYPFNNESQRLQFALQSAQGLIRDFNWTASEAMTFFEQRQEAYWQEFGARKTIRDQLNQLYREWTPNIEEWLSVPSEPKSKSDVNYLSIIEERSVINKPLAVQLANKTVDGNGPTLSSIISSLLHMAMNRIFTGQLRLNELIVYHFLARYYKSQAARLKSH